MILLRPYLALYLGITMLFAGCTGPVDPLFGTEQRYKHDLYSAEDCKRISANPLFSCSETVRFNPDGTVDLLLGGGDMVLRGTYQRKGKKITVQLQFSPKEITFKTISDNELRQVDTDTRWLAY